MGPPTITFRTCRRGARGLLWLGGLLLCAFLAAGCSQFAGNPGSSGASVGGYGDIVKFDGITYWENAFDADVGPGGVQPSQRFAEVEFRLQGSQKQEVEDGDAGLLPPGTPVYALEGYDPSFRLAARREGGWGLYEVAENPRATEGADILNIRGKVERVEVTEGREAGTVEDPEEVEDLVDAVLEAPVWRAPNPLAGEQQVVFRLKDGTATGGMYDPRSGRLSSHPGGSFMGISLSTQSREALREALQR